MFDKKIGMLKRQTILLPDGTETERAVRKVVQSDTYDGDYPYQELGWASVDGFLYMVERSLKAFLGKDYHETPWTIVEDIEPKEKKKRGGIIDAEGKEWLDDAVEWIIHSHAPYEQYTQYGGKRMYLPGHTASDLAKDLFGNWNLWAVERNVGRTIPSESLAYAWEDGYRFRARPWVSLVNSSLKRLYKKERVFRFYGLSSSTGQETLQYAHIDYEDE